MRRICVVFVVALFALVLLASDAFARCGRGGLLTRRSSCKAPRHRHHTACRTAPTCNTCAAPMPQAKDTVIPTRPAILRTAEPIPAPKKKSTPSDNETYDLIIPAKKKTSSLPRTLPAGQTKDGDTIYMLTEDQYRQYQQLLQQ